MLRVLTAFSVSFGLASHQDPSWDEDVDPEASDCSRSEAADAASVTFGEAEELAESATVALEHAAAAALYASAARAIPERERARKQGTKYVEKAHAAYLKAFTDTAAALDQRQTWLADDRKLLDEHLSIVQQQRDAGDPCLADTETLETNLRLVSTLQDQLQPSDPAPAPPAPVIAAPPPAPPSGRPLIIGGAVSLGVGGGLGLVALATGLGLAGSARSRLPEAPLSDREQIFSSGAAGNALEIVGIALTGVGIAIGVPLLIVGKSRSKRAKQVSIRPSGLGIQGSF